VTNEFVAFLFLYEKLSSRLAFRQDWLGDSSTAHNGLNESVPAVRLQHGGAEYYEQQEECFKLQEYFLHPNLSD
jgi:hypothetical protein